MADFPSIPVVESFTGVNGTTPPNADWTNELLVRDGLHGFAIQGNAATGRDSNNEHTAWYNRRIYGPNMAASIEVPTLPGATKYVGLLLRTILPGTANWLAWGIYLQDNNLKIYRDAPAGALDTTVSVTWSAGDTLGAVLAGGHIEGWQKSGGVWTKRAETDHAYAGSAGYAGLWIDGNTGRLDNFSVGALSDGDIVASRRRRRRTKG